MAELNSDWKKLWLTNYRGDGETSELASYVKTLEFGAKRNANYLPWAVVDRIFKLQDGKTEILKQNDTIVETDRTLIRREIDENGVVTEVFANSYFINIKVNWQGQEHVERYPLQDASGKPLQFWTQNELNKSVQRGKVKAIAIVSGIGYKLFENNDLQFEVDEQKPERKDESKPETKTTDVKPAKVKKPAEDKSAAEPVKEEPAKEEPVKEEPIKKEPVKEEPKAESPAKEEPKLERGAMEDYIKRQFLSGVQGKTQLIRGYLDKVGIKKIQELSNEQLNELYQIAV